MYCMIILNVHLILAWEMISDDELQNSAKIYCLHDFFNKCNFFVDAYCHYLLQKHMDVCPHFPKLYNVFTTGWEYLNASKYMSLMNKCESLKNNSECKRT